MYYKSKNYDTIVPETPEGGEAKMQSASCEASGATSRI